MGYRFLLGVGVLGVTGLIFVLQHDTISKSHGPYVIPLAVGTWLLWSPVRALLWGEGVQSRRTRSRAKSWRRTMWRACDAPPISVGSTAAWSLTIASFTTTTERAS